MIVAVVSLFFCGIAFMLLYYKLFHVSKLGSAEAEAEVDPAGNGNTCRTSLVPTQKSGCGNGNQVSMKKLLRSAKCRSAKCLTTKCLSAKYMSS